MLTESQRDLLIWMVESGETTFLLQAFFGPRPYSLLAGPGGTGKELSVDASDVRELAALSLIRSTSEEAYDLTNAGRLAYQELITPALPAQPRRVGF